MPFLLILIGLLLAISAYRGTGPALWGLVVGDFTGKGSFIWWVLSIMVIGGIGYIPKLKEISDAFLVLVIGVLLISNKGFFAKFDQAMSQANASATPAPKDATSVTGLGGSSSNSSMPSMGGSSDSGGGGDLVGMAGMAMMFL